MQRPRAWLRRRSPNNSNTRSAFASRPRSAPRRRRSSLPTISPPPTTGMPSSSSRRASIASTSRYRTAIFDFANTISSVEEYPRLIREAISRHAAFRPSSKPFKKALRVSSSPIPMARIRPRRAYRDFAASANIPEVLALVRRLRRGLDVLQLRGDLVDLLRLRLQLVERDFDPEILRQHFKDRLRRLRVDEISGRLAHEADRVHVIQSAEAQQQAARPDDSCPGLAPREHHAVLLHLFHELQARRGPEDPRLRDHAAHGVSAAGEDAPHVEQRDDHVVRAVAYLHWMGPLKLAPVAALALVRGVPGRHRLAGGMAARRAPVLEGVATARAALLQDGSHRLNPSDGTSPRRPS